MKTITAALYILCAVTALGVTENEVAKQQVADRPRLVLPSGGWKEIQSRIETNVRHRAWVDDVKKQADTLAAAPVKIGRNTQKDLMALALVFKLEGGDQYLAKVEEILKAAYEKPMWDSGWKLDQAMVSVGVAIAYDWLYDDLPATVRRDTERNLAETSLACYLESFDGGAWWTSARHPENIYYNNHNGVCNGAALVVASALLDSRKHAPLAHEVVAKGLSSMKEGTLDGLLPDGAWDEGAGYFGYGMTGMTMGLSSVYNSLGTLFGLLEHPGIGKTGSYLTAITGPAGTFNYADGTSRINPAYWMCWFAARRDASQLARPFRHLQSLKNHRGSVLGLCWDDPSIQGGKINLPLDASFRRIEVGALRQSWADPKGAWVGFKFGRPWQSHAHADIGSFVYDVGGVRWAIDIASPPYLQHFFSYEDERYHFYGAKPEGHNTLVINPSNEYQQIIDSDSRIERLEGGPGRGFVVGDMTAAYANQAKSVRRGFMLDRSDGSMLVQDEMVLEKPSEVWWFMHTVAEVELKDGGKTVVLTSNNKQVVMNVVVPKGMAQPEFIAEPAKPLPSSRIINGEYPCYGKTTRLALHFKAVEQLRFAVSLRSGISGEAPPFVSLNSWKVGEGEALDPVTKAEDILPAVSEIPLTEYMIDTEGAGALLDDNWMTVWSANSYIEEGGIKHFAPQSIQIDLEKPTLVQAVGLGFDTSFQRRYDFRIHLSDDAKTWTKVFHGQSGKREGLQTFFFPAQKVRHVKIDGLGNERFQNRFNELKLFGPAGN